MNTAVKPGQGLRARIACTLLIAVASAATAHAAQVPATSVFAAAPSNAAEDRTRVTLKQLLAEVLDKNPEIRAAARERDAASHRVSPAGALDDPMLEAGVLNLPTSSFSFTREDMTMKMLGLSQRFPYPGKRDLRREVAQGEADSISHAYRETLNRVTREVKIAYYDLALVVESARVVQQNRALLEQLLKIAEGRYSVGQASQVDVLRAQTSLSRMTEELIKLGREQPMFEADLNRLLARPAAAPAPAPAELELKEVPLSLANIQENAISNRPQLLALQALTRRGERALELARKESYPDLDVRFSYAQRDSMPDGTRRSDMVNLTFAINLPVWRQTKTLPRIAEAQATYEQSLSMYEAQRNETLAKLRQQVAAAEQSLRAAALYRNEILPQSRLTIEAALAAYQVNRLEFAPLLDNRMAVLNFEIARVAAIASYNKALAEIDFLTGASPE